MPKTMHPLDTMHQGGYDIPILIIKVEEVDVLLDIFHSDLEAFSKRVPVQLRLVSEQTLKLVKILPINVCFIISKLLIFREIEIIIIVRRHSYIIFYFGEFGILGDES